MAQKKTDAASVDVRKQEILSAISDKLRQHFGRTIEDATENHLYKAVALVARDEIVGKWMATRYARVKQQKKRVYYLSIEFLIGRSLSTNLINLCKDEAYRQALADLMTIRERKAPTEEESFAALAAAPPPTPLSSAQLKWE